MTAKVDIINEPGIDAEAIIQLQGYQHHRVEPEGNGMEGAQHAWSHLWLIVDGVDQAALENVVASFDPMPGLRESLHAEIMAVCRMKIRALKNANFPDHDVEDLFVEGMDILDEKTEGPLGPSQSAMRQAMKAYRSVRRGITDARQAALDWIKDPSRTVSELQNYDPVNDPAWP